MTVPDNDRKVNRHPLSELDALAREYPPLMHVAAMVRSGRGAAFIAKPNEAVEDALWPHGGNVVIIAARDHSPRAFPGIRATLAECQGCAVLEGDHEGAYASASIVASMGCNSAIVECTPELSLEWLALAEQLRVPTLHVALVGGRA